MGGTVYLPVRFSLYGDRASDAAALAQTAWQAWMDERFPAAGEG